MTANLISDLSADRGWRVVVASVGKAAPAASSALARGLGIPAARVVACLYRAPAVLIDGIGREVAQTMVGLLARLGYVAEAQPESAPAPGPCHLFDVALHIADPHQADAAAEALAGFTGMTVADAMAMLLDPPSVVLGAVSAATVAAFRSRLPDGVEAVASRPEDASYQLYLGDGPEVIKARLRTDLVALGFDGRVGNGLVATGVSHRTARDLWQRHQAGGLLRVVNEDFLRFDLVLHGAEGVDPQAPEVIEALSAMAEMPAEAIPMVFAAPPIVLRSGLTLAGVGTQLPALAELGLDVRAELTTFQRIGLEVLAIGDRAGTEALLRACGELAAGQSLPTCPFSAGRKLPETQARIRRAALETLGCTVRFEEDRP